ncbi:WD40-repeat-containing domain protein [Dichotomocladium elegans]|nr:WD40-repeat-containing domain protein [Dichotomocladium elegans]
MSTMVDSQDALRLIIQFLRENNLTKTLSVVQKESSITFNTIDDKNAFIQDIVQGRWDTVLRTIEKMTIEPMHLFDLHEQIVDELIELKEFSTARMLLSKVETFNALREHDPERYVRLAEMADKEIFIRAPNDSRSKEEKRRSIAQALADQFTVVPSSQLLALLGQSLRWQQHQGALPPDSVYDLYRGTIPIEKAEEDAVAAQMYCNIKFPGKKAYAETAVFSPNGQYLATGTADGFIELWNYLTGKLRKDLKYQAEDRLMAMDEAVLCLNFSRDSELLVSGSNDGKIAVWRVQTGVCQRRISPAHSQGVTSVCFNKDGTQILSGSYDQTVKIHGLKSGRTLKEFRGHSSFVNSVLFSNDGTRVVSGSSDGTVKVWDTKTTNCLHTITPQSTADLAKASANPLSGGIANHTVQAIVGLPKNMDQVVVCTKSNTLYIMNLRGHIIKTLTHQKKTGSDFVAAGVSPQCELVYGIAEDSTLYCFQIGSGKLISKNKICDHEAVGIASHPQANVVVSYDDSGHVYFLKA